MSAVAEAFVRLRPDTTGFRAEAQTGVTSALAGLGGQAGALGGAGLVGGLKFGAGLVGITTAAAAAGVAVKAVIGGASDLETELNVLQVVSGATEEEMRQVSDTATALGQDLTLPAVTAADAAQSMNELAKAGLDVNEVVNAAKGTLQLATAAEVGFGDAAKIVGSALNVFNLEGSEATHVADLLAGASIAAQGEITDMAMAFTQSGAMAKLSGLSVEQLTAAVTLLAKNGILGSDAGTSIRTMLQRLIPTTKEAAAFTEALGIEFDKNATIGEQLPDLLEQYRVALSKLTPALQQQALVQIFGADAIRAASILIGEGSAGFEEAQRQADRTGAAQELATAKTKGLAGAWGSLGSQLETVAITLGTKIVPPLTDVVRLFAEGVGGVNDFVASLERINEWKPPPWFQKALPQIFDPVKQKNDEDDLGRLGTAFDYLDRTVREDWERLTSFVQGRDLELPLPVEFGQAAALVQSANADIQNELSIGGAQTEKLALQKGRALIDSYTQGILGAANQAVAAARETLARVRREGQEAVRAAVAQAQQNLASIGQDIAAQAATAIDAGPIARRIEEIRAEVEATSRAGERRRLNEAIQNAQANLEAALRDAPIERRIRRLQDELDRSNRRDQRRDVARTLRDAQEELASARRQAQVVGPLTGEQLTQRERFLRPFVEDVQDAKGEVDRFNKETTIETLTSRLSTQTDTIATNIQNLRKELGTARQAMIDAQKAWSTDALITSLEETAREQKETITNGINEAINAFNQGKIDLPELSREIARLLKATGIDYETAGKVLGQRWVDGFEASLEGLSDQAKAILAGPQRPGIGLEPTVVRPANVVRDVAAAIAKARADLDEKLLEQGTTQNDLLKEIRDAVKPRATTTTSAAGTGGPGSTGGRFGSGRQ